MACYFQRRYEMFDLPKGNCDEETTINSSDNDDNDSFGSGGDILESDKEEIDGFERMDEAGQGEGGLLCHFWEAT